VFSNEGFVGRHVTPVPPPTLFWTPRHEAYTLRIEGFAPGVRADSAGDALQTRGVSSEWGLELWARILGATGWPPDKRLQTAGVPSGGRVPQKLLHEAVLHHLLRDSKTAPVRAACLPDTSPRRDGGFSAFRASRAASYSPGLLVGSFSTRNQRRNLATRLLIAAPHSSYRTKARTNSRCDGPVEQLKRKC